MAGFWITNKEEEEERKPNVFLKMTPLTDPLCERFIAKSRCLQAKVGPLIRGHWHMTSPGLEEGWSCQRPMGGGPGNGGGGPAFVISKYPLSVGQRCFLKWVFILSKRTSNMFFGSALLGGKRRQTHFIPCRLIAPHTLLKVYLISGS